MLLSRRNIVRRGAAAALAAASVTSVTTCDLVPPGTTRRQRLVRLTPPGGVHSVPGGVVDEWDQAIAVVNQRAGTGSTPFRLERLPLGGGQLEPGTLARALAQGPAPDLVGLWPASALPVMVLQGLVQPLDRLRSGAPAAAPPRVIQDLVSHRGQTYAAPLHLEPLVLWYDTTLFDARGIAPPDATWTWERLGEVAAALRRDTDDDGVADQWGLFRDLPYDVLIWQAGGELFAADDQGGRRVLLREAAALPALQFAWELYHRYEALPTEVPHPSSRLGGDGLWSEGAGRPWRWAMAYAGAPVAGQAGSRIVRVAEVPRGRVRATRVKLQLGLAVSAKAADPPLAYRAVEALTAAFQEQGKIAGLPPSSGPAPPPPAGWDPDDHAVVLRSLAYARSVPLALQGGTVGVGLTKLDEVLRQPEGRPERAAEEAAAAVARAMPP